MYRYSLTKRTRNVIKCEISVANNLELKANICRFIFKDPQKIVEYKKDGEF